MAEPTYEEMKARLAELEKQVKSKEGLLFRVSTTANVSVYGLGRFPVTLSYNQWQKLLAEEVRLREFMEANKSKLKV